MAIHNFLKMYHVFGILNYMSGFLTFPIKCNVTDESLTFIYTCTPEMLG